MKELDINKPNYVPTYLPASHIWAHPEDVDNARFLSFFSNLFKFGGNHQSLLTESKLVRGENLFRQKIQLIDHFLWSSFNGKPTNWKTEIYHRISLGNVAKNLLFLLFWNGGEDNDDNVL